MSMSRKDFAAIAEVFNGYMAEVNNELATRTDPLTLRHVSGERVGAMTLASRLATALQQTNPRFDSQRFIEACGVK